MKWKKIITREYGVQYTEVSIKSLAHSQKKMIPETFEEQVYVPEQGNEVCYIATEKWDAFVKALHEKYIFDSTALNSLDIWFNGLGRGYVEVAQKISEEDLGKLSNTELVQRYKEYQAVALPYATTLWATFLVNDFLATQATEILEKHTKDANTYEDVLRPAEKVALLQLQDAVTGKELREEELEGLHEKYQWLSCLDIHNAPWTLDEFKKQVAAFKPGVSAKHTLESVVQELELNAREKDVFKWAQRFAYLKDIKDDYRRQGIFYARTLFAEIGKRMKLNVEDVSYLLGEEILGFLEKDISISEEVPRARKEGFTIYFENGKIECKHGTEAEDARKKLGIEIETVSNEIKGTVACRGKVTGKVVLVHGVKDLGKVETGDILVAITTHPDYVAAMHKAAAIVTDEGGMLSHAAIVSRELGIPCVVGCGNATKVLKEGMRVEVNAEKGIVKKV